MLCATLPMSTPPRRRRPEGTCSTDMACDATTAAARAAARIARGAILISVEVLVEGNLPSYDRRASLGCGPEAQRVENCDET